MTQAADSHQDQVAYWNGPGAERWVAHQVQVDLMLAPVSDILFAHAGVAAGCCVLDLGCGCGATTEFLAARVGPGGRVMGLDVSAPMIEVAKRRLAACANVELICADAAKYAFAVPVADLLVSRFGVMFFGDPTDAFANFGKALKPGGRMVFACWRGIAENPWMQVPLHAAYTHVPRLPKMGPDDPGPFAFADIERVTRIMSSAGFGTPTFTPRDVVLDIAGGGGLEAAVEQASHIGATSRALEGQPEQVRDAALGAIRSALQSFATPAGVLLKGAIWIVEARRA